MSNKKETYFYNAERWLGISQNVVTQAGMRRPEWLLRRPEWIVKILLSHKSSRATYV